MTEFSDFQCPACRAAAEPLKQIQAMFPGRVRLVFKHLPLAAHPLAPKAAAAAECAGMLAGKFWAYHDALYSRQEAWTGLKDPSPLFSSYARELGVPAAAFDACLNGPEAAALVAADKREASERWIKATPTFFVDGLRFVGVRQLRGHGFNRIERTLKR